MGRVREEGEATLLRSATAAEMECRVECDVRLLRLCLRVEDLEGTWHECAVEAAERAEPEACELVIHPLFLEGAAVPAGRWRMRGGGVL